MEKNQFIIGKRFAEWYKKSKVLGFQWMFGIKLFFRNVISASITLFRWLSFTCDPAGPMRRLHPWGCWAASLCWGKRGRGPWPGCSASRCPTLADTRQGSVWQKCCDFPENNSYCRLIFGWFLISNYFGDINTIL